MSRVLVRGGCVLTLDAKVGNHRQADILVEDGVITEIGPNLRARNVDVVDAADCIVMPGFVDTHRHLWESLFRRHDGLGDPSRLGPHYSSDDVYAATLVGLLGALEAGITTVVDWAEVPTEHLDAALQAHADAGVRSILVHALPTWADEDWAAAAKNLAERPPLPYTRFDAAPPSGAGDPGRAADEWAVCRSLGLRIHAHIGATRSEQGTAAALGSARLLRDDVTLVHCSSLDDSDFDAIASASVGVAIAPAAEMAMGHEPPPMQRILDRGIRPGLATATERLAPGDLFAAMRAAISVQHATYFDLKLAGKGGLPNLLTTREVIRYATIDGARVVGLDALTGTLSPGKQADIVVLRADRPNIAPVNDPIGAVVWGMDTSNIDWVIVGGEIRVREGRLETDIDRVRTLALEARTRVASAAGILSGVDG
ncbi:MAG TPA: amidohydrolase family protein [Acidimicrobiia bacterium]